MIVAKIQRRLSRPRSGRDMTAPRRRRHRRAHSRRRRRSGHRRARRVPPRQSRLSRLDRVHRPRRARPPRDRNAPRSSCSISCCPARRATTCSSSCARTPATRDIAVLMLTARREEQDRIRGLALGADDYLTKPFSPQELVLRVGAILRRMSAGGVGPSDVVSHRSDHDRPRGASRVGRRTADRAHADRIQAAARRSPSGAVACRVARTCSKRCGKPRRTFRRARSTCTCSDLRTKLGEAGDLIETVRGFGYRLKSGQSRRA